MENFVFKTSVKFFNEYFNFQQLFKRHVIHDYVVNFKQLLRLGFGNYGSERIIRYEVGIFPAFFACKFFLYCASCTFEGININSERIFRNSGFYVRQFYKKIPYLIERFRRS